MMGFKTKIYEAWADLQKETIAEKRNKDFKNNDRLNELFEASYERFKKKLDKSKDVN